MLDKLRFLFNDSRFQELKKAEDNNTLSEDMINPNINPSITRVIRLAREKGYKLELSEIEGLSLIYIKTITQCVNNDIPLDYLKDSDGIFKKYNDAQLLVIQDGIEYDVDIRLFSRNIDASPATMTMSVSNIIEERRKRISNKSMILSARLQKDMYRGSLFGKLQIKLFGGFML